MTKIARTWIALVSTALFGGNACAMGSPNSQLPSCQVVGGSKLPAGSGGPAALCEAIQREATARAPGVAFTVEVKVLSSSRLEAILTREGRRLPEQNFATMDRELSRDSFERFAAAIAEALKKGH